MIPKGWHQQLLGDVCEIKIGGTPARKESKYWAKNKSLGYTWVSIADLKSKWITNTKESISELGVKKSNVKLINAGTTIMSFKLTIGRVARAGIDLYTNEAIAALVPLNGQIDNDFLYYALPIAVGKTKTDQAVKGATLNKKKLNDVNFLFPPFPEQKKIAAILSSVDDAIQATQAVIDQTRMVKQGLLQQLLTCGIGHTRFKQTEIGEIPEEWDVVHLSEIASHERSSFTNGPFGSNLLKSDLRTTGVPVIYIRDIKTAIYNPVKQVYVDKDKADELSSCEVLPGDILITKVGDPPGIASIYPEGCERAIVTQDVIRLRTNHKKCEPEFVRIVINSPLGCTLINNISIEGTRKRMALGTFKKIPFPLPTLPEQEQITKAITLTENTIIEEQRKLNCFQHVKRGLMQDLLTGRVRVKLDGEATT